MEFYLPPPPHPGDTSTKSPGYERRTGWSSIHPPPPRYPRNNRTVHNPLGTREGGDGVPSPPPHLPRGYYYSTKSPGLNYISSLLNTYRVKDEKSEEILVVYDGNPRGGEGGGGCIWGTPGVFVDSVNDLFRFLLRVLLTIKNIYRGLLRCTTPQAGFSASCRLF